MDPSAEQAPFVVDRVPDDELVVSVPFELEPSEWEFDGAADGPWGGWDTAGGHGPG